MTEHVVFFPAPQAGPDSPGPARVGGKGASLIRMVAAGLPVPPGAILCTDFFATWFDEITATPEWTALVAASPDAWRSHCAAVRRHAGRLQLDTDQKAALAELARGMAGTTAFAVRSSSPEEDLSGASFAGGYVTRLGVSREGLEDAVRDCFVSALDVRVLVYKHAHGFDPFSPRIAVVVQAQVDAETAGVGFSLDPLSNDYDTAVFDAAWGLGESVVSGAVSPDHFVVDKVTGKVVERTLGAKQRSVHLAADGAGSGLIHREDHRAGELTLDDAKLRELVETISRIETLFACPIDIEWAYAGGDLFVLQARPITTWVPIPETMQTAPGARRRLYMDIALGGGLTINAPISPIGQSWMEQFAKLLLRTFVGRIPVKIGEGDALWVLEGGRMYQDLSNVLRLVGPRTLSRQQESRDALMAATLANIDRDRYRAERRPSWMSLRMALRYPVMVWRTRGLVVNLFRALFSPGRSRQRLDREIAAFRADMRSIPADLSVAQLLARYGERVIRYVLEVTMPPLIAAMSGQSLIRRLASKRDAALVDDLDRGFVGNVVVDMGVDLHRMARLLAPGDADDPTTLAERVRARTASPPFLEAWDAFFGTYGWRGPSEVDLGAPRYADSPALALDQVAAMARAMGPDAFDPARARENSIAGRRRAFEELCAKVGPLRRALFRRFHRWIELFGGERDTPKHQYLMFFAAVRRRVLGEGRALAEAGRLDDPEDVFDLTLQDLDDAADPTVDLRARKQTNTRFIDLLRRHVTSFPAVIDSRGRIVRPAPHEERTGELTGNPVSPGVARGPVKVLHGPTDKSVEPGDVLVAHTTDPGWTPLFVNAAAIVLEVGGALQHGAVVAREYGKPCVAGISDLLNRFEDGQFVEVDGTQGVVRVLETPDRET